MRYISVFLKYSWNAFFLKFTQITGNFSDWTCQQNDPSFGPSLSPYFQSNPPPPHPIGLHICYFTLKDSKNDKIRSNCQIEGKLRLDGIKRLVSKDELLNLSPSATFFQWKLWHLPLYSILYMGYKDKAWVGETNIWMKNWSIYVIGMRCITVLVA